MSDYSYLDLLEKKLDEKQRRVCCSSDNTIVAAGAGSGKTQVLATRFAWLVMSQDIRAPQILTLTFTKKAAGEMYERIYQTLSFFAKNDKTPAKEKEQAIRALEEFSDTHIQTLDSYCNSIVKQAANRYGIRPDFTAGSSDSLEDIKDLALPFIFANKDRACIQQFAKAGKLEDFAYSVLAKAVNDYTTLADPPDFFVSKLEAQKQELTISWNSKTSSLPSCLVYFHEEIQNALQKKGSNDYITAALSVYDILTQADTKAGKSFEEIQGRAVSFYESIKEVKKIVFPQGGHTVTLRSAKKDLFDNYIDELISLCAYIARLEETTDLYKMFDEFTAIVNASKRQTGNLTFADISELAFKILQEQEDLRIQEQNAYTKIMIDEFQDNNAQNKELLFLLNNGGQKLFFVGDEKQSIYKFRGADVSVFNRLKDEFGDECCLKMNFNYRSSNELITTFNRIFGENNNIFDKNTDAVYEAKYEDFAIKYDPVNKVELPQASLTEPQNRRLTLSHLEPDTIDTDLHFDKKDQLAIHIAKSILKHKALMEEKEGAEYNFSKFAILDRSRTDRRYLIKWLNVFNIPYTLDTNTSLFADGPINDIYNFLQICVYPQDRISYAGYLSSPFANLSEQSIETLLAEDDPEKLTDETERKKALAAINFLNEQKPLTLSRPLTKTIELLWNECGYRYETMFSYRKSLYEEQFDYLFELARQMDLQDKGIAWFVDELSKIKNTEISGIGDDVKINAKDITYPIEKGDAVNIMTIHKSKGLQFEYVFVYGCTSVSVAGRSRSSLFFFDPSFGLTIKPEDGTKNFFFLRQQEQAAKEELAEFRRLIYVAITRAEKYVEITGEWPWEVPQTSKKDTSFQLIENMARYYAADDKTDSCPYILNEIEPVTRDELKPMLYNANSFKAEKAHVTAAEKLYREEPVVKYEWPQSNRKTPSSLEKDYIAQTAQDSDSGQNFDSPQDTLQETAFTAADFGTLVHAFLEAQANGIPCNQYIPEAKLLKNLNETPDKLKQILDECKTMCLKFAQSESGKALEACKAAGLFYRAEWAFRMLLDGYIFTGSIDLIFQNADGTYTIVDYKSDKQIDVEKYRGQQECYKKAASRMLKIDEEKISCCLYFLRHDKTAYFTK